MADLARHAAPVPTPALPRGRGRVVYLGNCQLSRLALLMKLDNPELETRFYSITEFWGDFQPDEVEADMARADLVVSQLVLSATYRFHHHRVRATAKGPVVFVPYVYVDGFGALEVISSKGLNRVQGLDTLAEACRTHPRGQVTQRFLRNDIDMAVTERFQRSIDHMLSRERQGADVRAADFIAEVHRDHSVCFAINHPTPIVLDHLHRQIAALIGARAAPLNARCHFDHGRLNLPAAQRVFSPYVVEELGLTYPHDPHWYSAGVKLVKIVHARVTQAARDTAT